MESANELEDRAAAYNDVREQEIEKNSERLKTLGVPALVGDMAAKNQAMPVQKQRRKLEVQNQ